MASEITLRPAIVDDAAALARLSGELGYPAETDRMRERIRPIIAGSDYLLVLAEDAAGAAIGWIQAHAVHVAESGFRVEIVGLIVSCTARRQGVGRRLVAEVEDWARALAAETVVVRSNVTRAESHRFYPLLGYVARKTQIAYRKPLREAASGDPKPD